MRKQLRFIKAKLGFLTAILLAAVVGGLTTNLVRADIPDANGQVTACYRSSGGDLHVIDTEATPAETCSNQETALGLQSFHNEALIGIVYDSGNQANTLDTNSTGVIDFQDQPLTAGTCIEVGFQPHFVISPSASGLTEIKVGGTWSGSSASTVCSSVTNANLYLPCQNTDYATIVR
jgi:hypothetical protein